jgi:nucleotide-binding universal stress UspA family protein
MYRSILVPLDGSPLGEHALPLAVAVARRTGAAIRVAHAHAPVDPKHPDWYMPPEQRSDPAAVGMQKSYLDGTVRKLTAAGVTATSTLLEGPTVEALCEHVATAGADLVVMTTHGRGPLSRLWLGSVADALVRRLTVPLLLVRPKEEPADLAAGVSLRHILIPLDGSKHAESILGPALALGEATGAAYTLLRVVEPVPVLGYDVFGYAQAGTDIAVVEELRHQAVGYLEGVAGRLRGRGLHVRTLVLVNPSPAGAILTETAPELHDLVALETHGRGGPARLLLGSVADKVIRGSACPVLVHRSPEPDAVREGRDRHERRP